MAYDGARIVMTVLTWNLDLDKLAATADRCAQYQTFFDPSSKGIPMTTTKLPSMRPDALVYQQTMELSGAQSSVFFAFENVARDGGVRNRLSHPQSERSRSKPRCRRRF